MTITKAVIYTRFSPRPADQMENCVSSQTQEQECRKYAKRMGYRVVGVYHDEGVSRDTLDRVGLAECVQAVRKGMVVIFYHPDRLGSTVPAGIATGEIERKGGRVEYTLEELNGDGPMTVMMRTITHAMAEFQRAQNAIKTSAGMKRRQSNGQRMTSKGKIPYGTQLDPNDEDRIIESPDELAVISRIIHMRSKGLGYKAIAEELDSLGTPTRSGNPWQHSTVRNILERHAD